MKFRNFQVDNEVFLAPMAGVTDLPFRLICKEHGCGLLYTEMINAKALCFDDENTKKMLKISEEEMPVAVQIFGSEPEYMARATEILNLYPNEVLDINMGCPAPKVVKNGDGSALMKNPELVKRILDAVLEKSKKPVSIKIRKGWDESSINALEIAKIAEGAGVDAIAIHGRTREQYYSGEADWNIIKEVKSQVKIPIIGNGDVVSVEDAIEMRSFTKCDAIMIGRGAQGNPWIFDMINQYVNHGKMKAPPSKEEKIYVAIKHLKMATKEHGEYVAVREMRKHIGWYLKGMKHSARFRDRINHMLSVDEVIEVLEECAKA